MTDIFSQGDLVLFAAHRGELPQLASLAEHRPFTTLKVGQVLFDERLRQVGHLGHHLHFRETFDAQRMERAEERI